MGIFNEVNLVFGPVPSRRLGKSLGVNNIPPKICTYSCVYCQLGRSLKMTIERSAFYKPEEIFESVKRKVESVERIGGKIDYITFVPDGEPTLDVNLGIEAKLIKKLGKPVAIITNSSLMYLESVRMDLMNFDLVSVKVDAVSVDLWRKIDRAYGSLDLEKILDGIKAFSTDFKGTLISETMIVDRVNYGDEFERIARYLSTLPNLKTAYISIPTRPPAEDWASPPAEEVLNEAFQAFESVLRGRVEYLIGYEGDAFSHSGDFERDILSITAVHPMREEAVQKLLESDKGDPKVIEALVEKGLIKKVNYQGHTYYVRRFR
ncbi:MAG: radical SAM protein [Caldisericum sp.]|nr:radical SAM protein [Caldisericum sp.]